MRNLKPFFNSLKIKMIEIKETNMKNVKNIFRKWTETMTMHAFPNIFRTNSRKIRFAWIALFLISSGFCFYISLTIINFLNYDVVTKIRIVEKDSVSFHAVTICNANHFVAKHDIDFFSLYLLSDTNSTENFVLLNRYYFFHIVLGTIFKSKNISDELRQKFGLSHGVGSK